MAPKRKLKAKVKVVKKKAVANYNNLLEGINKKKEKLILKENREKSKRKAEIYNANLNKVRTRVNGGDTVGDSSDVGRVRPLVPDVREERGRLIERVNRPLSDDQVNFAYGRVEEQSREILKNYSKDKVDRALKVLPQLLRMNVSENDRKVVLRSLARGDGGDEVNVFINQLKYEDGINSWSKFVNLYFTNKLPSHLRGVVPVVGNTDFNNSSIKRGDVVNGKKQHFHGGDPPETPNLLKGWFVARGFDESEASRGVLHVRKYVDNGCDFNIAVESAMLNLDDHGGEDDEMYYNFPLWKKKIYESVIRKADKIEDPRVASLIEGTLKLGFKGADVEKVVYAAATGDYSDTRLWDDIHNRIEQRKLSETIFDNDSENNDHLTTLERDRDVLERRKTRRGVFNKDQEFDLPDVTARHRGVVGARRQDLRNKRKSKFGISGIKHVRLFSEEEDNEESDGKYVDEIIKLIEEYLLIDDFLELDLSKEERSILLRRQKNIVKEIGL